MAIRGLFIGCNYPGESYELPDCDLDSENLAATLEPCFASGRCLLNKKASRKGVGAAFRKFYTELRPGDVPIVSFSGHGTSDTIDGKEVQGIVCNDGVVLYEFELRQLLADLENAVLICDSCFSGGLPRARVKSRPRTVPASHVFWPRDIEIPSRMPAKPRVRYLACKGDETADSTGNGGAFTNALIEAFDERKENTTFISLANAVKKMLPNKEHRQTPVFSYADRTFASRTLKSFNKKWNIPPRK